MQKYTLRKKLSDAEIQTTQKIKWCRSTDFNGSLDLKLFNVQGNPELMSRKIKFTANLIKW